MVSLFCSESESRAAEWEDRKEAKACVWGGGDARYGRIRHAEALAEGTAGAAPPATISSKASSV